MSKVSPAYKDNGLDATLLAMIAESTND